MDKYAEAMVYLAFFWTVALIGIVLFLAHSVDTLRDDIKWMKIEIEVNHER